MDLDIASLQRGYRSKIYSPEEVMSKIAVRIEETRSYNAWIYVLGDEELQPYLQRLEQSSPEELPLWGIPFAIKDNIDLAGCPTTAACPDYSYVPQKSARVVEELVAAGAIPIGKTNLDQFATGLVGTRSPHGATRNALDPDMISGGSSAGSAVAVKLGLCSFSLGTDTAGSGRVPAALNELIGFKPTRGWLSTSGVVPACRTLDCVSIFANTVGDAAAISNVVGKYDATDTYSRNVAFKGFDTIHPRYGCLSESMLQACDDGHKKAYQDYVSKLPNLVDCDSEFLFEAAELLYQGPWLAERYAALSKFLSTNPDSLHPTTLEIISGGAGFTAVEAFEAQYKLADLKRKTEELFTSIDVLVIPTVPTAYSIAQVDNDPIQTNSHLGVYTNFVNLLDLCAIAIPAARLENDLPFGVTLVAAAGHDYALIELANALVAASTFVQPDASEAEIRKPSNPPIEPRPGDFTLAVCGAHLSGQPLNSQLLERGGYLVWEGKTSENYRLYALPDGKRPAMLRDVEEGCGIDVEVWSIPAHTVGSFVQGILPPLGIGSVELANGSWVNGFIAEPVAIIDAQDITHHAGWRGYLAEV